MGGLVSVLKDRDACFIGALCEECLRLATETESLEALEMLFLIFFFLFSGILSRTSEEVRSALCWKDELLRLESIFSEEPES